ncbi:MULTISPECIES: hypothetical protein [unclassified Wolbachia]|uniref:hypothetical protein n=1 Tax=unclassified Wolbachia TaxID=2640676 RepID=UPI001250468D|nr:hypothetical protein [Wolbachia endosymbiont of Nasonia oneida]KAB2978140.1 hypothetical protein DEF52_02810 [Wolbachia endosymbiont of Nasonia oneida]MDX5507612.1 hypothetical protein [Wolbachia endosymbiont of Hylaeus sinuatus]
MSKNNVELYFNEKISDQEKLIELKDPSFTKPDFVKPNINSIKIDNKDKNADIKKLDFDINQPLDKIPVEQMKPTNVGITYLKKVYDGLIDSINKYNTSLSSNITTGIVEPLSTTISNIGNNTTEIKSQLQTLRDELQEFRDDQPGIAEASIFPHATGEENGLL